MKSSLPLLAAVYLGVGNALSAFGAPTLPVLVPESAGHNPSHFNTHLRVLAAGNATSASTAQFNTPAMIRAAYNLPSTGGSNAIAIVDAYHFPTALADFNSFSTQFGLPKETSTNATKTGNKVFQVVYASGRAPQSGGNYIASWNLEAALDIEWAHAMAPSAKIYLVEAASDSMNDLNKAVKVAAGLPGVKEISMSWGGSESAGEASNYDPVYTTYGIVYLASSGDTAATLEYPSASPNVVSCGGTSLNRDANSVLLSETGWASTGCGPSVYESRPSFQTAIASIVGTKRGTSDISFVADPNTGVYVYDSTPLWGSKGWWILGGTSVSSPSLAGLFNLAATSGNGFAVNTAAEQARIYGGLGNAANFRDITSGAAGTRQCVVGWDYVTGVGSPIGLSGK